MKRLMTATCFLLGAAAAVQAQGRGGRQGGPGAPTGPLCLNPTDVASVQTTNHSQGDGTTSEVILKGKQGVGQLLNPCPAGLGGEDPMAKFLFPPDVIMSHQQAINLSDSQRTSIGTLIVDAQKNFVPAQFKIAAEMERLQSLIDGPAVDEGKVLDEVDRVLALERDIKRAQLTLMIRVKNLLTPQQQDALSKLRSGE
jgi:hypothetical protein